MTSARERSVKARAERGAALPWLRPKPRGGDDWLIALAIAVLYTWLLYATVDELGYARDEGFYFVAARRYEEWFRLLLSDSTAAFQRVDEFWRANHEHPSLVKSLFAVSHALLWEQWRLTATEGESYRLVGMALSGLGLGTVFLWGTRAAGRLAGMVAALTLSAMPRFFFHAHLACFDAPVVTFWTLAAFAYWCSLERGGLFRAVLAGVAFGLALDTKHNAWFLPVVCGLHALGYFLLHRRDRDHLRRAGLTLACMATLGPLVFLAAWPWLWHDTVSRLEEYARFHLHHVYYNMEFLGRNYFEPPLPTSYAFVMTAATVPVTTLVLFVVGVARALRARVGRGGTSELAPRTTALWLLALAVQYGAWLLPTTPIFGGTKHWMTAYPFLCLFAGVAVTGAVRAFAERYAIGRKLGFSAAAAVVLVLPGVVASSHAHPWGLSAYGAQVGGAAGGASLGLNRGFWGYTTGAVLPYLNENAPRGAKIYVHDTSWPAWDMLLRDGRLRADLRGVGQVGDADLALYHHELHMHGVEYQTWVALDTVAPVHIAGLDGVPVIWIYQRRAPRPARVR